MLSGKSSKAASCSSQSEYRMLNYLNFGNDQYYVHCDMNLSCPIRNLIPEPASDHTGVDNFFKLHPDIQPQCLPPEDSDAATAGTQR